MTDLYDAFLYDDHPFAFTHPDRLGAFGVLFGLEPTPTGRCRMLELGCGLGGNLVPLGERLPGARFVGVDRAAQQIAVGRRDVRALNLDNVDLRVQDILDVPLEGEPFDFIVCHGVFSWVPPPVQRHILAVCGARLAPNGVALVSYNTLPGWHMRGMIRDLLRREVPTDGPPKARAEAGRQMVAMLRAHLPVGRSRAAAWLKDELDTIDSLSDAYLFFEHLVDDNQPLYFRDFVEQAEAAGLSYLCDADFPSGLPQRLGDEAAAELGRRARGQVEIEQWMDYLTVRFFRRSLLVRRDAPVSRTLRGDRMARLRVTTNLDPIEGGFKGPDGAMVETRDPVVEQALTALSRAWPASRAVTTLAHEVGAEAADLGSTLLELFAHGHVEVACWDRGIATTPGPTPRTTRFARLKARAGADAATNLRHESIALDAVDRALLAHLDGTRDHDALTDVVLAAVKAGDAHITRADDSVVEDRETLAELVEVKLGHLARAAFLTD